MEKKGEKESTVPSLQNFFSFFASGKAFCTIRLNPNLLPSSFRHLSSLQPSLGSHFLLNPDQKPILLEKPTLTLPWDLLYSGCQPWFWSGMRGKSLISASVILTGWLLSPPSFLGTICMRDDEKLLGELSHFPPFFVVTRLSASSARNKT